MTDSRRWYTSLATRLGLSSPLASDAPREVRSDVTQPIRPERRDRPPLGPETLVPLPPVSRTQFRTMQVALRSGSFQAIRLDPGTRLDRYVVEGLLGEGGMSCVYGVRHVYLDERFALKTLREGRTDDEAAERFLREAVAITKLRHPGVIRVLDAGVAEGTPYFVMERIEGNTLREHLDLYKRLPLGLALDLLEGVARVLCRQEEVGIVHRDLKPGNVFLRASGDVCVFDYGLTGLQGGDHAAFAAPIRDDVTMIGGSIIGTPHYMAPEQATDAKCGHAADLFSLGLIVWEALVGTPVRTGNSATEVLAQLERPVPPVRERVPDVPEDVDRILAGLTCVSPADRYASAASLLADIEAHRYGGDRPRGPLHGRIFVALPFGEAFNPVFESIETAGERVALQARRMDRILMVDDVWNGIMQEIDVANVVVADFTDSAGAGTPNPNVVTEAAHARAIGKQLILISQSPPTHLPFDWRHCQVIRYDPTHDGLLRLAGALEARFRYCIRERRGAAA